MTALGDSVKKPSTPAPHEHDSILHFAAVEDMLSKRVEAKLAKRYEEADRLQGDLARMGVACNDRQRTWSATESPPEQLGPPSSDAAMVANPICAHTTTYPLDTNFSELEPRFISTCCT